MRSYTSSLTKRKKKLKDFNNAHFLSFRYIAQCAMQITKNFNVQCTLHFFSYFILRSHSKIKQCNKVNHEYKMFENCCQSE